MSPAENKEKAMLEAKTPMIKLPEFSPEKTQITERLSR
jgi:hypothetical protein